MAHLFRKGKNYSARFSYLGQEFKRSLKTTDPAAAKAALNIVELTLHRLLTGQLQMPAEADQADFIVSGGTWSPPVVAPSIPVPSVKAVIEDYLESAKPRISPNYHSSQKIHLGHLARFLGKNVELPLSQVTPRDLNRYLESRLAIRNRNTVVRERVTLVQMFRWAVEQGFLKESPAEVLPVIKAGSDRPPFRTVEEIDQILHRGGLKPEEKQSIWDCLYLNPQEITGLLATVKENAKVDYAYLLHAIPAYTGMRRGEVLRLRWLDVNFDDKFVVARSLKQSRTQQEVHRRIKLHPELKALLANWKKERPKGQLVISDPESHEALTPSRANHAFWAPMRNTSWCLDAARNWYKIGFHTYRHSFASNLAAAGVDQRLIDEFMGHQTEAMRRRYRHLFPRKLQEAIEAFSLQAAAG